MVRRFERSQQAQVQQRITVVPATEVVGQSTRAALEDAGDGWPNGSQPEHTAGPTVGSTVGPTAGSTVGPGPDGA